MYNNISNIFQQFHFKCMIFATHMYKVGNIVKQMQRKLFFKSYILTNGCSLGPGEEIILFFMPKILTSGSLKYLEIPLVVLYRPVLYKTTLRVVRSWA